MSSTNQQSPSEDSKASHQTQPTSDPELRHREESRRPIFWTPDDRPGHDGVRDRHKRRRRLTQSLDLNPEQLRDVLLFIYANQRGMSMNWTPDILYRYVPRTFEGAAVHESLAAHTLQEAMGKALFKQIPGVYEETLRSEGGHMIFELHWTGVEPEVPIELRDLPNLRIVEQAHLQYTLDSAQRSSIQDPGPSNTR
ncbi:hypothetical protein FQN55_005952 [Onygenales sp. PD_40]|nr:hypothetical protein FQN55_005952 [Onygenales sp. PD_40]